MLACVQIQISAMVVADTHLSLDFHRLRLYGCSVEIDDIITFEKD